MTFPAFRPFVLVSGFRNGTGQQASACGGVVDIRNSDLEFGSTRLPSVVTRSSCRRSSATQRPDPQAPTCPEGRSSAVSDATASFAYPATDNLYTAHSSSCPSIY